VASKEEQFGRYHLIRRIAAGGMGEVFLGRYLNAAGVERHAVVKRILPHLSADPDFVSYFVNEGRITSLLCHPNVVQTLELGRVSDQYYIAMEYIPGTTLVRLLAAGLAQRLPFSIPLALHLSTQLASALCYIHGQSDLDGRPLHIVHMDLAPHNVLVTPDGQAKLLDFGISRAAGLTRSPLRADFRGRTAYMAPERFDGLPLDHRVDLFALGIIMHEMVLGRPLFRAREDQHTASRVLYSAVPRLRALRPDCPEQLERIILRTLARDREDRYSDAGQVVDDLDHCIKASGIVLSLTDLRTELAELMSADAKRQGADDGREPFASRATSLER
jgi:serine/threonine protein kinase